MKVLLLLAVLLAVAAPVYASHDRTSDIQAPVSADGGQAP